MSSLREAATLALEALERGETKLRYGAIAALKTALAEPQSTHSNECHKWHHECAVAEVNRLRAALAEPVQEPVAWGVFEGENLHDFFTLREEAEKMAGYKGPHATVMPLYTTPPQRPAPCARHCEATAFEIEIRNLKARIAELEKVRKLWEGEK